MTEKHEMIISPREMTKRGRMYAVLFRGETLCQSLDPEFTACRALLARGITGKAETRLEGSSTVSMRLDIERAGKVRTCERTAGGLYIGKWTPFIAPAEAAMPLAA